MTHPQLWRNIVWMRTWMIWEKYLNNINEIGVDEDWGETKDTKNEYVIHRNTNENEPENNRDTLKKVIEEFPDDQDKKEKERTTEN